MYANCQDSWKQKQGHCQWCILHCRLSNTRIEKDNEDMANVFLDINIMNFFDRTLGFEKDYHEQIEQDYDFLLVKIFLV